MLFNSISFLFFFLIVYSLYLILNRKGQNILLLIASYIFYGAWDWRFLGLLIFSTVIDYHLANFIHRAHTRARRRFFLILSLTFSLGILGFFKYFNFISENISFLFHAAGREASIPLLRVILPLGISFYTFQTMSYIIDVYRKEISPAKSFLDFALFISFFPQLVAGPIERAAHLLPEIAQERQLNWDKMAEGTRLFFWGLFKKVVIADNMAIWADRIFSSQGDLPGFLILSGVYAFSFQILCDFSGYTDMARGLAKWMGFDLMLNFNKPYLAATPSEFWQRWHISLSSWLKSYLYIPLGGNRKGSIRTGINLMLTMTLGGLWHGASWTFVTWGAYHGLLLIFYRWFVPETFHDTFWKRAIKISIMFHLTCLGWIFFRAESLSQSLHFIRQIIFDFQFKEFFSLMTNSFHFLLLGLAIFLLLILYLSNDVIPEKPKITWKQTPFGFRWAGIFCLGFFYLLFAVTRANQFIYFQF